MVSVIHSGRLCRLHKIRYGMMIHNHLMRSAVSGGTAPTIDDYSILYTTSDGSLLVPNANTENPIVTNVYKNGVGKITFTNKCTSIEALFCLNNTKLTSVTLPDCCITLYPRAFRGCTALTSINLDNVQTIGTQCFHNDTNLVEIGETSVLSTINANAFYGCGIKSIFMTYVTTLGSYAFSGCTKLTTVKGIISCDIPSNCFYGCTSLTSGIAIEAFGSTRCKSIGILAFGNSPNIYSIRMLKSGSVVSSTPPTLGTNAFSGSYYIYVPSAYLSTYKAATNWSSYSSRLKSY